MNQDMLSILRGLDPSSLEYDISYHTNNADSEASKQRQHAAHLRENDRLLANFQKALELVESITQKTLIERALLAFCWFGNHISSKVKHLSRNRDNIR